MELDKRVTLRLSASEHKKLIDKATAKGMNISTYIRSKLNKKKS